MAIFETKLTKLIHKIMTILALFFMWSMKFPFFDRGNFIQNQNKVFMWSWISKYQISRKYAEYGLRYKCKICHVYSLYKITEHIFQNCFQLFTFKGYIEYVIFKDDINKFVTAVQWTELEEWNLARLLH